MTKLVIKPLDQRFTIHRFPPAKEIPAAVFGSSFYCIAKTDDELSVVCDDGIELAGGEKSTGWSCLKVLGPIDFSQTGVLAGISAILASGDVSIFAISTYDTDYILLPSSRLDKAISALAERGYQVQASSPAGP